MSDRYDPTATETEERSRSDLITRKDVKVAGVILIILALVAYPVYQHLLRNTYQSICKRNLRVVKTAFLAYTSDYEGRAPYVYQTAGFESNEPALTQGKTAYTWNWPLSAYTGRNTKDDAGAAWKVFLCPASEPVEYCHTTDPEGRITHSTTYGMVPGYGGVDISSIPNPGQRFIIGETSNHGAMDSYDPLPLVAFGGEVIKDNGFLIGFDNSNDRPDKETQSATRLAYYAKNGAFDDSIPSRHPDGLHFLALDGSIHLRKGSAAQVYGIDGNYGQWEIPPPAHR